MAAKKLLANLSNLKLWNLVFSILDGGNQNTMIWFTNLKTTHTFDDLVRRSPFHLESKFSHQNANSFIDLLVHEIL